MAGTVKEIGEDGHKLAVITPSLLCNYDCPYCRIKKKERASCEHELSEWFEALIRIGAPVAHIAGGEPTVLKGVEEFVVKYPAPVRMTTNLWKHPSKWSREFWQKFEYMTLSFHPSHTSFEKFNDKVACLVNLFADAGTRPDMACTIVAFPEYLDNIKDWIDRLTELGVNARGQYYNAPANDSTKTYTGEQLEKLKSLNIPMSAKVAGQEVFSELTLKSCNAGMYYTHIDVRGNARRCSRDQMGLGNIFEGSFKWFEEDQQCNYACTEACDLAFAKHRVIKVLKRAEGNKKGGAVMAPQMIKKNENDKSCENRTAKLPVHNLEYQNKALAGFAAFCSHKGKDILEIGSDPELRVIQYLGEKARSVFGITNAKKHWKYTESGEIIVSDNVLAGNYDARSMLFEDNSYDAILSIATFEHIIGLEKALDEMYRVLRPGGVVYSVFGPIWSCAVGHHIHLNLDDDTFFRFWREDLNPVPNYYHLLYNEKDLADIMTEKYGGELAGKIAEQVYHADHINRLMYSEYIRIFNDCKFHVGRVEDKVIRDLSEDVKEKLTALYGSENHFECGTIEVVLYKPRIKVGQKEANMKEEIAPEAIVGSSDKGNQIEEAILSVADVIALHHDGTELYPALCNLYLSAGRTDILGEWIIKAVRQDPGIERRLVEQAERLLLEDKPEFAIGMLSALVQANPDNYDACNNLGVAQLQLFSRAEDSFKNAIALKMGDGEGYKNLAALYLMTGRQEMAVETCREALEEGVGISPDMRADLEKFLEDSGISDE